ncbi:MAG: DUF2808 domain-containing protein [Gloeobacterales cyanobacterium]
MYIHKTLFFCLCLSLSIGSLVPVQAGTGPNAITESLNSDSRLKTYGPYRLKTEQEQRWLLLAEKGGPDNKLFFQKTSTQAALIVMRFRPDFQGNLDVQSKPWQADISTDLLLSMATGKITLADYFKKISVNATEPVPPKAVVSKPTEPPAPPPNKAPRPQFDRSTTQQVQSGQPITVAFRVKDETPTKIQAIVQILEGEKVFVAVKPVFQKQSNLYVAKFGPDVSKRLNPKARYSLRTIVSDGELFGNVRQALQVKNPVVKLPPEQPLPPVGKPTGQTQPKPSTPPKPGTPQGQEPVAMQPTAPTQIAFSEQTSEQIVPGEPLKVETTVTAPQPENIKVTVQLLDKDKVVATLPLTYKDQGLFQGAFSEQETADLTPGRSYQLKSLAEAKAGTEAREGAEAIEDVLVAKASTEEPGFTLQIPSFFNPGSNPKVSKTSWTPGPDPANPNATYQFTVALPEQSGKGMGQILVDFPEGWVPPSAERVRLSMNNTPIPVRSVEFKGQTYGITFENSVPAGSEVTVEIPEIRKTASSGNANNVGVTVLPAGDLPAYYELPTVFATALKLTKSNNLYRTVDFYPSTYQFGIRIPPEANQPLARLTIAIPDNFGAFGANLPNPGDVKAYIPSNPDSSGPFLPARTLNTHITLEGRTVVIDFDQPVEPDQTVAVDFKPIRNPSQPGTYLFEINAFPIGSKPVKQFVGYGRMSFQEVNHR